MQPTDLFEFHYYQGISGFFAVISVLSFFLNSSVVAIFVCNQSLFIPSNYLLLSMAFCDVLRAVFVLTVAAYATHEHLWTVNEAICQYFAFASTVLGLTSMTHLVALAVERWWTMKTAAVNNVPERKMAAFVGGLWLYSVIWSVCPLIGWSSFGPEPGYAGCSINWHSTASSDKAFIACLFVLFFFLPVVFATFCYISVYIIVRKMAKNAVQRWGSVAAPTQETFQAKAKTAKMSVVMLVAFLIAWSPYAVVSMYSSFISSSDIPPLINTLPSLFAKLSSCYNPIIYFFMYSKFRKAGKDMFIKYFKKPNQVTARQIVVIPLTPVANTGPPQTTPNNMTEGNNQGLNGVNRLATNGQNNN